MPEGVYAHSITKRQAGLIPVLFALMNNEPAQKSDVWDIVLRSVSNPSMERTYTLEIMPIDEQQPPQDEPPATNPPANEGPQTPPATDDPQPVEPADRNDGTYENQPLAQTGDAAALPLALFLVAALLSTLGARHVTKGRGNVTHIART